MECVAYATGRCRSCTLLDIPHARQVADKALALRDLLAPHTADAGAGIAWEAPLVSVSSHFRSKAKMVVAGTVDAPTVGILDADGRGIDLRDCPLYEAPVAAALPVLARFITHASLVPYDVARRSGELKHILVSGSPSGEVMVRFVMRSTEAHARLLKHLPWLREQLPHLAVASLNVLPEHKAVLEGEREIMLTERETLPMPLGDVTLHMRPQSFFQTNTAIARELYKQVAAWVDETAPRTVWDLYCGVGGFALHCVAPGRLVTGVEVAEQAIASARITAAEMVAAGVPGAEGARFEVGDATAWAQRHAAADLVIVNPPRRGIGVTLAQWLENSSVQRVIYSSCNPQTLARDLDGMPSLKPTRGRLLDMFPHTEHYEAVVLLERQA